MQLGVKAGVSMMLIGSSPGCTADSDPTDPGDTVDAADSPGSDAPDVPTACEGLVGEGYGLGQIAKNWSATDRDGNTVSLYDSCGKVIFYENGAEW